MYKIALKWIDTYYLDRLNQIILYYLDSTYTAYILWSFLFASSSVKWSYFCKMSKHSYLVNLSGSHLFCVSTFITGKLCKGLLSYILLIFSSTTSEFCQIQEMFFFLSSSLPCRGLYQSYFCISPLNISK